MVKQSIFGRIAQLAKANINTLLDNAEDPQKMLDQMVRDYTNNIAEAESAVAQTIGNLRMLEDDYREDVKNAQDWGNKALAASRKAATRLMPRSSTTSPRWPSSARCPPKTKPREQSPALPPSAKS